MSQGTKHKLYLSNDREFFRLSEDELKKSLAAAGKSDGEISQIIHDLWIIQSRRKRLSAKETRPR